MKKLTSRIYFIVFIISVLASCAPPQHIKDSWNNKYKPINTLPMYGAPAIQKTEAQKKSDETFIKSVIKSEGSRENAAKRFSMSGWLEKRKGNKRIAVSRFNQSWLLDPNYYQPYWGFGAVTLAEGNPKKAAEFFETALGYIDDEKEKPRLQVDAARAYAWQASEIKNTNAANSEILYKKANSLIDKALNSDPKYSSAYSMGGLISYEQGNYKRAWEIVKKSRDTGSYKFNSKFIEKLSKEMPEP